MSQKRALKRVQLRCRVDVLDADGGNPVGQIIDIHTAGMLVMSEKPLQNNSHYRFKLVPVEGINGSQEIDVTAQSVWSKQEEEMGFYTTGFSISEISEDDRDAIGRLIEAHGVSK